MSKGERKMKSYVYFVVFFYCKNESQWGHGNLQSTINRSITMDDIRRIENEILETQHHLTVRVTNFILLEVKETGD